jgi:hypothetical protein
MRSAADISARFGEEGAGMSESGLQPSSGEQKQKEELEMEKLSLQLEDRSSVVMFVWAFALSCVAFVSGGLSIKLFHDSTRVPKIAFGLGVIAVTCTLLAFIRLVRGFRLHSLEVADFERLQALRRQFGLDQPQLPSASASTSALPSQRSQPQPLLPSP